ncbi:peroxisome biogenesis factor 1 isoform X3 [Arapaima gigas]
MNRRMIKNLAESISKEVKHFNKTEAEHLIRLFNGLVGDQNDRRGGNGLDRGRFRNILHNTFGLTDDMMMDRVFRVFDKDNDSYVSVKEWIEGLSVFLRGTFDEKIKYCFDIYDLNGNGYISREEMFHMLKNSLIRQPTEEDPEEGVKDLVEIALKKMDHDHDSQLSYADFERAVKEENLLLEAFGTCLPDAQNQVLELCWGHHAPVYLSWSRCGHRSYQNENTVEVNRQLGDKLGIKDGEQGFLRPCHQVLSVQQVYVEPLSSDDWEILELHSSALEQQLLDQIRVVFPRAVFPVWVDQHTIVYIRIDSLSPAAAAYGRLEQCTELVVTPKSRGDREVQGAIRSDSVCFPGTNQSQSSHWQENLGASAVKPFVSSDPMDTVEERLQNRREHQEHGFWVGITDLRSLIRYIFTGSVNLRKEVPLVPSIPPILRDSILRVTGHSPPKATYQSSNQEAVHILPWSCKVFYKSGQESTVTYGCLTRLCPPWELREDAKRASEKKRGGEDSSFVGSAANSFEEHMEPLVVEVVCHYEEQVLEEQSSGWGTVLYNSSVWIPKPLRRRLNIELHSAVRIQPLKSTPRIASAVKLHPLQPLPEKVNEDDVQSAFLDWLHSQKTKFACFLGRSSFLHLPIMEESLEFAVTVLKPEREGKVSGEVFFLTTSLLQKADIQVVKEVLTNTVKPVNPPDDHHFTFPSLESLGGMKDIGGAAFEHISHSLMGGPLSQQLLRDGQGLRSGAAVITGSKGSGKTTLARALCRKAVEVLDAHVEVIDCKTLKGKRVETIRRHLDEVFEQAVWRQPSVVLLDDLDHMAGAASSLEQERGAEAVRSLQLAQSLRAVVNKAILNGSLVALISTSQSAHSLHPSLVKVQGSHFFQCFTSLQSPDQAQRVEILAAVLRNRAALSGDCLQALCLESVARETEGWQPRDLTLLVERAIHANVLQGHTGADSEVQLSLADFQQALRGFKPPSLWQARLNTPGGAGLEQVGGLREARQVLMDTLLLPAKFPTLFSRLPIRHRSGVLLYGAPGTGKTLLAGAVARDSGMNFISIKGPELLSKYIGASEQAVRDLFERAQSAKPCILFFDEFDSLAPRRGHDSTGVTDRVVNQLLTQLDGVEGLQGVYVLAATSRPDLIDPALLRPGRLDKCLYCPPPDQEARLEILQALTRCIPLAVDVDLEQLAGVTDCFTGADLKALLYNAQLEAVHIGLGATLLHDPGSGSDSDGSLSSMIFLNQSSGSDDSAGEGEGVLDQSVVLLESSEVAPEDPRHNMWRLYFGSSYESELGNPSPSDLNSQCLSGPNSVTHDLTGASLRDSGNLAAPAFMASLQEGYQELNHEQLENLRAEINCIKTNIRGRNMEESLLLPAAPSKPPIVICQAHLTSALANTRASMGQQDWKKYTELYEGFGTSQNLPTLKPGHRVTLA